MKGIIKENEYTEKLKLNSEETKILEEKIGKLEKIKKQSDKIKYFRKAILPFFLTTSVATTFNLSTSAKVLPITPPALVGGIIPTIPSPAILLAGVDPIFRQLIDKLIGYGVGIAVIVCIGSILVSIATDTTSKILPTLIFSCISVGLLYFAEDIIVGAGK